MLKKFIQVKTNPLESYWFYAGAFFSASEWGDLKLWGWLGSLLLKLPGPVLLSAVLVFLALRVISITCSKLQELADGDSRNVGPILTALLANSGHALSGCGLVALLHFFTHGLIVGTNLQLFILCLLLASCFYWLAWMISKFTPNQLTYYFG